MHLHFLIVVGSYKFENWHLYRFRQHRAVKNKSVCWRMWDRLL